MQWDTDEDFEQALEGGDTGAGCSEIGFGSCVVTDAAVAGQCPYSLLITGLTEGEVTIHHLIVCVVHSPWGDMDVVVVE